MKALIQRVKSGAVAVDGREAARIGPGYVVLLGVRTGDLESHAEFLARKTANLRIFPDAEDRMNRSIVDTGGEILVISQFTLYADTRKGNRPGFTDAAQPAEAEALYESYVRHLRAILGEARVRTGVFRASMLVDIHNDGPVTVELSTDAL